MSGPARNILRNRPLQRPAQRRCRPLTLRMPGGVPTDPRIDAGGSGSARFKSDPAHHANPSLRAPQGRGNPVRRPGSPQRFAPRDDVGWGASTYRPHPRVTQSRPVEPACVAIAPHGRHCEPRRGAAIQSRRLDRHGASRLAMTSPESVTRTRPSGLAGRDPAMRSPRGRRTDRRLSPDRRQKPQHLVQSIDRRARI